jgi:mono/diheme cytochrome c family protein
MRRGRIRSPSGAYLVEALAHCGECHTPRNLFQALDNRNKFAGAVTGGWRAFNITGDPTSGVGDWSEAALAHYLGAMPRGAARRQGRWAKRSTSALCI